MIYKGLSGSKHLIIQSITYLIKNKDLIIISGEYASSALRKPIFNRTNKNDTEVETLNIERYKREEEYSELPICWYLFLSSV